MGIIQCNKYKGQNKINFDLNNKLNHRKLHSLITFWAKTYETNREKGQNRSVFKLKICKEM